MASADNNAAYYRMRERRELDLAKAAEVQDIKDIHLNMAEKYRVLAEQAELAEGRTGLPE